MSQNTLSPDLSMHSSFLESPQSFQKFAESRSWEPGWLADFRKDCWDSFSELPDHILKDERWRFSPRARFGISKIAGLADSKNSLMLSQNEIVDGVLLDLLDKLILDQPHVLSALPEISGPDLGADEFYHLTGAFAESGFVLRADESMSASSPIVIEHSEPELGKIAFHHNLIELGAYSEITLIEKFTPNSQSPGGYISNLLKVKLGEGAKLNRIVIQNCSKDATLMNLENFVIGKNANLHTTSIHLGCSQSRIESRGILKEPGAHFEYGSAFLGKNEQIFDQRTIQIHEAPHCTSNLLCKNALRNESKSVFSGLIKVEEDAQHTDAYQTNRNLLLSSQAEADSLPGLEILANEVKCSHGATTSKIDPQELFYLKCRGIAESEAEKLIALGFLSQSIDTIYEQTRELALEQLAKSFDS